MPRVRAWWNRWPHANIGIPTGRASGLVVVDLDGREGLDTWQRLLQRHSDAVATAMAQTPHGEHHWYRLPAGLYVPRRIRGLGAGIDVLGDGGYAVAPPSRITSDHTNGQRCGFSDYSWTRRQLQALPAWIAAQSQVRDDISPHAYSSTPHRHNGYVHAALQGEVARVASARIGTRNDTLNLAAYHLGRLIGAGLLTRSEAERALLAAAAACGLIADDGIAAAKNTIASGLEFGAGRPRHRIGPDGGRGGRSSR
jgi:hypothetical protein